MTGREACAVVALLAAFFAQAWFSSPRKGPTEDLKYHLAFGQTLLGRADRLPERFPGEGVSPFNALQVAASSLRARLDPFLGPTGRPVVLPQGRLPSLRWARLPTLLAGLALLLGLWAYMRRLYGPAPALTTLFLAAFLPDWIGHSRFVTTDIPGTAAFVLGLLTLAWTLTRPTPRRLTFLALVLALCQLAKLTSLYLYPVAFLALAARLLLGRPRPPLPRAFALLAGTLLLAALAFIAVLQLTYLGVAGPVIRSLATQSVRALLATHVPALLPLSPFPLPRPYVLQLAIARVHNQLGHPVYFHGTWSATGFFYYYPALLVLKTPLPVLLLAAAGLVQALRRPRPALLLFLLAAAGYLAFFILAVRAQLGLRHVFPAQAALVLLAGLGAAALLRAARPLLRWTGATLLAAAALACLFAYPHYAQFFTWAAGGPFRGWRYTVDSSLDWGQDEFWARAHPPGPLQTVHLNPTGPVTGWVYIRAARLVGRTPEEARRSAWLREHYRPVTQLTPAVFVYWVPPAQSHSTRP